MKLAAPSWTFRLDRDCRGTNTPSHVPIQANRVLVILLVKGHRYDRKRTYAVA